MPLYAYRCTQCGHKFEKIQKFSDQPESECPKCHGALERPLTAPALSFKGAGWYVNDYASKSSAPASESNSSTDSAPAAAKTDSSKESSTPSPPAATPAAAPASTPATS